MPDIDLPGMDFFGGAGAEYPAEALPDDLLPVPSGAQCGRAGGGCRLPATAGVAVWLHAMRLLASHFLPPASPAYTSHCVSILFPGRPAG